MKERTEERAGRAEGYEAEKKRIESESEEKLKKRSANRESRGRRTKR